MSGGHFNGYGYIYYKISEFADELENEIEYNDKSKPAKNRWEDEWAPAPRNFRVEVIDALRHYVKIIRTVASAMKAIDFLYSNDIGEDAFLNRIEGIAQQYLDGEVKEKIDFLLTGIKCYRGVFMTDTDTASNAEDKMAWAHEMISWEMEARLKGIID